MRKMKRLLVGGVVRLLGMETAVLVMVSNIE